MNKKEIKNHFQYRWWLYVVLTVAVIALWITLFGILGRVDDTEKFHITFIGSGFDDRMFKSDLPDVIKSNSKQNIEQINVESIVEESDYALTMLLSTRTQGSTDLFIWSGELKGNLGDMFARLNETALASKLGDNVVYLRDNDGIYGIEITKNDTLSKYYSGNEKCYLFVSADSVNFGGINGKGAIENDVGLSIIKYLLGGE